MRKWFQNTLLIVISLLLTLLLLEIISQILSYREIPPTYMADPILGTIHKPDVKTRFPFQEYGNGELTWSTNNAGLREDQPTYFAKEPGVFRILVLGDSHTDGMVNNAESYANVLETLLNEEAARQGSSGRHEVLNAGMGTYSPLQQLLWWRTYGYWYKPDLVIVGFYVGNDLLELVNSSGPRLARHPSGQITIENYPVEGVVPATEASWFWNLKGIFRPLRVYQLTVKAIDNLPVLRSLIRSQRQGAPQDFFSNQYIEAVKVCAPCLSQSFQQAYYFANRDQKEARQILQESLTLFKREAAGQEIPLIIILIPTKRQVEPEDAVEQIQNIQNVLALSAVEATFDDTVYQWIGEITAEQNLLSIDMLPVFREYYLKTKQNLYYRQDWHINAEAHNLIARTIFDLMMGQKSLIEPDELSPVNHQ
ncbi:MAG: hypothetical protein JW953_24260 [Anaerolineae bacterium]|nr:hypothetical protein [Anaerolineae bacterium]